MRKVIFLVLCTLLSLNYLYSDEREDQNQQVSNAICNFGRCGGSAEKIAQSFVPSKEILAGVAFWKRPDKGAFTGNVIISIQEDLQGAPSGDILQKFVYSENEWKGLEPNKEHVASLAALLQKGKLYWLVFEREPLSDDSFPALGGNGKNDDYVSGELKYFTSGKGWMRWVWSGGQCYDLYFRTYWGTELPSLKAGTTSDKNDVAEDIEKFSRIKPSWDMEYGNEIRIVNEEVEIYAGENTYAHLEYPLDVDDFSLVAQVKNELGSGETWGPGIVLYWDKKKFCSIRLNDFGFLRAGRGDQHVGEVVPGRWHWLKIQLTPKSFSYYLSFDGRHWRTLKQEERPPDFQGPPSLLIAGKGWTGTNTDFDNSGHFHGIRGKSYLRRIFIEKGNREIYLPLNPDRIVKNEKSAEEEETVITLPDKVKSSKSIVRFSIRMRMHGELPGNRDEIILILQDLKEHGFNTIAGFPRDFSPVLCDEALKAGFSVEGILGNIKEYFSLLDTESEAAGSARLKETYFTTEEYEGVNPRDFLCSSDPGFDGLTGQLALGTEKWVKKFGISQIQLEDEPKLCHVCYCPYCRNKYYRKTGKKIMPVFSTCAPYQYKLQAAGQRADYFRMMRDSLKKHCSDLKLDVVSFLSYDPSILWDIGDYLDFVYYDIYAYETSFRTPALSLAHAFAAAHRNAAHSHNIEFGACLQSGTGLSGARTVGSQFYTHLAQGVKAIDYFYYNSSVPCFNAVTDKQRWDLCGKVHREIEPYLPLFKNSRWLSSEIALVWPTTTFIQVFDCDKIYNLTNSLCLLYEEIYKGFGEAEIVEERQVNKGGIDKFKVLVLGKASYLTEKTAKGIEKFVRGGGYLIVTSEAGKYNQDGEISQLLRNVIGGTWKDERIEDEIKTTANPLFNSFIMPSRKWEGALFEPGGNGEVIATFNRSGKTAVFLRKFGKGKVLVLAFNPESFSFAKTDSLDPAKSFLQVLIGNFTREVSKPYVITDLPNTEATVQKSGNTYLLTVVNHNDRPVDLKVTLNKLPFSKQPSFYDTLEKVYISPFVCEKGKIVLPIKIEDIWGKVVLVSPAK